MRKRQFIERCDQLCRERDEAWNLVGHWYTAATDAAQQRNELYAAARKVHAEHGNHPHSPCDCYACRTLAAALEGTAQ